MNKWLSREDVERLLWQIGGKDNWEAIYEVPSWLAIYDSMPPKMQMVFNFKLQGYTIEDIARIMGTSERQVYYQVAKAKKRILESLINYKLF